MDRGITAAIIISLIVVALLGGYYIWMKPQGIKTVVTNQQSSTKTQSTAGTPNLKGFVKAQEIFTSNRGQVQQLQIHISYTGTLTRLEPEKSWTIEQGGGTAIVKNESGGKITYQMSTGKDKPVQAINAGDLKIGDKVFISSFIDATSSASTVNVITVIQ